MSFRGFMCRLELRKPAMSASCVNQRAYSGINQRASCVDQRAYSINKRASCVRLR